MTIRADRALQSCDAIVGYGVYVDLVKERYPDKAFYETAMTQEAKRCALALDLARAGQDRGDGLLGRQRHLRHGGARVRAARQRAENRRLRSSPA